ncbi:MAG: cation:dicarboxylase symporter family transporter [Ruminobacter sp.]|uniref:cation:dicarboxylate symporter family transporter n=1 Tax=Ruminobacter sp. TaxID=2774296 RepID=UPI001B7AA827|nr:cation:dicarboxylase symporter family transporter [Ruminobacter sp.]MBP3748374.1 cation:dicarboxylase symporter family transporter [Ruminobacter sp.]
MNSILAVYKKTPLVIRLVLGLFIGGMLGLLCPEQFMWMEKLGYLFVTALKSVAPILVFILLTNAIVHSHIGDDKGTTYGLKRLILMFFTSAFIASALSIIVCSLYRIHISTHDITPNIVDVGDQSLLSTFVNEIIYNPVEALVEGRYLSILIWSAVFGFFIRQSEQTTKQLVADLAEVMTKITKLILELAPIGVMGLMFHDMVETTENFSINFKDIIILFLAISAVTFFIVNPLLVFLMTGTNAFKHFPALEKSILYSFFTCSSAANIPVNQQIADEKNVTKQLSTISIPLGASIHKPGSIITINMLALTALYSFNPDADITMMQYLELGIVSVIASICTAGVPNGSIVLIPIACRILNVPDDMILKIIEINIMISFIRTSTTTVLNSSSDLLFTLAIDERHKNNSSELVDNIINAKRVRIREENENAIKKALQATANGSDKPE